MMNRTIPNQERPPASEPVWERPWSVEEIRKSSQSWSLAADAGLLQFLQEFSQQTISRTHEIKKQVDGLIRETKATDCRLHNVFNDFLMLSNTQFIENRVYDEEVEEPVLKVEAEKAEQEKTREQKEVDLIPKVQEAVNYGLQVLDSAFEQLDIKAGNSDSEEDDANERVELILEPKDLYIDRPLPYLIGSKLFMEQEDVGLGELSSEEGSVGSDRGSIVDSEEENQEEESDEDFANHSDNDQNRHTTQMSDEEEDDDGCDIFADSEKEEEDIEDIEENTRPKRSRPTSFADELAARIKGDATSQMEEEQTGKAKPQKTFIEKKERRTPSDDEDGNLFAPPKLTDEDFSPFGSGGGLFSGGKGLFDDDEEEENDLFTEAPQGREARVPVNEVSSSSKPGKRIPAGAVSVLLGNADVFGKTSAPSLKEPQKPEQPTSGKSSYLSAPAGLFDVDDDDDFFAASLGKPSKTEKVKSTTSIFDEEEGDLFKEKAAALPEATVNKTDENKARAEEKVTLPSSKNLKLLSETKTQKGLFSDEEDTEDLFSQNVSKSKDASLLPSKFPTSVSLFDDEDEEDNLFGATAARKQTSSLPTQSQEKAKPSEPSKKKASALLFSSDEEDQWNITDSQTNSASDNRSKGELRVSGTSQDQKAKAVKKTSLFEEDDEDDLFAIAKDSQKKTQRASLLFEDDADSGSSLFGSPPTSAPPATTKKETVPEVPPLLFSDEEEKEAQFGVKPVDKKVESAKESAEIGRTHVVEELEKEGALTVSTQEVIKHSDLFSSSSPMDKGTKSRTKTVLSLFDEEEDKTEDQNSTQAPKKEVGKSPNPDARPKSTGVFQDEELLFSHKLQKDNDPDVDLFSGTKKTRSLEPSVGSLFGDDEDDDLFSSAKSQPLIPEKKRVVKKDHSVSSFKSQKHPEFTQGIKEKSIWKPETPQDSPGFAQFKTKEPSPRIWKIQANLAINPAALLPAVAPQISGMNPVLPELAFPSSEPERIHSLESMPTLPGSVEAGVSFDLPAQADTLHSANKSRVKVRGKRRPQTRAARRLAAQESSESADMSVPRRSVAQLAHGAISPDGHQPQPRAAGGKDNSEEMVAAATSTWTGGLVLRVDRSSSGKSLGQSLEDDLFDSEDTFSKGTGSQSMEIRKAMGKAAEGPANLLGGGKEKSSMFPVLGETGSDDDLFQSVKPKPAKKNPFPLLEDEDDLFPDQKGKNESKPNSQQDVISNAQDIFEDDIFATEAIKPSRKTREKERTFDPNLFDDNIDIFADLTIKPKEKSKKKVEAKSIFDDDMDDIFSSGVQAKTTKPKSRSSQAAPEPRSEQKVANIFDDPLNAFAGQ
ncbi:WASH complex subunit 2A-like isoform X2 [Pteropus vampyrus]|uniref:WASH complex subunit 2A-like isoform X2 n=1 Tax=Pteropus vampyrus TaxID=132908 RepID=A0A6P3PU47_PTEVA|nr:WASH complex subunit 2A-like isoform X2 [Pteropus vampyrus]